MEHPKSAHNPTYRVNDLQFIEYLQQQLGLTEAEIAVAARQQPSNRIELPIRLWDSGIVDLEQLERIFDWMEEAV
jgi:hypothetical protein